MEYSINKLSKLAGISTRTLRYYDEINLLKPNRINSSGYRIYGQKEIDILQQILFYKELGVKLEEIKKILTSSSFNSISALKEHHAKLLEQKNQIEKLIVNVEKTISFKEGKILMSDQEKFDGFKQQHVMENEQKYGKEIREKYGDKTVNESYNKFKGMTKEEFKDFERISKEILTLLKDAFKTSDPGGELAQKVTALHHKWLGFTWNNYSKEAHRGLAKMYITDERFTEYYDKEQPGLAKFLHDAIYIYTK